MIQSESSHVFTRWLQKPLTVLMICAVLVFLSLAWSQNPIEILRLRSEIVGLENKIESKKVEMRKIQEQVQLARDPLFIQRQALELFDLAEEHDLVFVFPHDEDFENNTRLNAQQVAKAP